jgi:hypothetical protein
VGRNFFEVGEEEKERKRQRRGEEAMMLTAGFGEAIRTQPAVLKGGGLLT